MACGWPGVPIHLIADNAAGMLMRRGKVDVVLFGADRVAANGDVVNKIGTYKVRAMPSARWLLPTRLQLRASLVATVCRSHVLTWVRS